jgi:hypothetical protein
MSKKLLTNVGLIVFAVAVVIGVQMSRGVSTVQADPGGKTCICHAAGSGGANDPQQYICLHPSDNATVDNAQAGHLNEDATHGPAHAPDFVCDTCADCEKGNPQPSPSPSPK